jgi:hypothetical protein
MAFLEARGLYSVAQVSEVGRVNNGRRLSEKPIEDVGAIY